ncbi:thioesterase domain-containing protein, partial [Planctomycetota bacterium]
SDIPIGRPIANTEVLIVDSSAELVPVGAAGEICAAGDGLARGYLNDPVLTEEKFVAHPFRKGARMYRTGDLGRWLPDGTVEFLGRKDDQVKIRGYRIEPGEVEQALREHAGVREAVVTVRDRGADGTELLSYVTGARDLDGDELREHLKRTLPDYMVPFYFTVLEELPLTPNGKVDRRALPDPGTASAGSGRAREMPATDLEKELSAIWEEVLGHKGIGATDDFFDVGGHSLKVTKLVASIHKRTGIEVPIAIAFKASSIREQAAYLMDTARFGTGVADDAMVLLSATPGSRPVFAFPPGTGDCLSYIRLAGFLEGYSLYGFNFIETGTRISDYADLIAGVDAEGPCLLLGYSSGGNLAYHVAAELERRDVRVSDIIMLDSGRATGKIEFPEGEAERVAELFLGHESLRPYLENTVLKEKAARRIKTYYTYMENSVDSNVVDADIHVILGRDSEDLTWDTTGRYAVSVGAWAEATRGTFRTYEGEGDHYRMLHEPALERNAALVRGIIDEAVNHSGSRKETTG